MCDYSEYCTTRDVGKGRHQKKLGWWPVLSLYLESPICGLAVVFSSAESFPILDRLGVRPAGTMYQKRRSNFLIWYRFQSEKSYTASDGGCVIRLKQSPSKKLCNNINHSYVLTGLLIIYAPCFSQKRQNSIRHLKPPAMSTDLWEG